MKKSRNDLICPTLGTLLWRVTSGKPCIVRLLLSVLFIYLSGHFSTATAQQSAAAHHINIIASTPVQSIRGLSAVTDNIVWASGTGGQVGRSLDGGRHWQWNRVSGCDSCDWRSLYAFNDQKAVVLNAGEPAQLFLTTDGGTSWKRAFYDTTPGIFFDALSFFNAQEGIAIGDPLSGRFTIIRTHDGGLSWHRDTPADLPAATTGESIFAASGTGLVTFRDKKTYFATGGTVSRLFHSGDNWHAYTIPVVQGTATTGTFSITFLNPQQGIAVGGDYKNDTARSGNCMLTSNGGRNWVAPSTPPGGYKSGVAYLTPHILVTTGTSGTDISYNGGKDWQPIGAGFNVVTKARKGNRIFLAGKSIAVLESNK
ncbi:WD40/YVTN/BNR-like repeat-containing protein [Chitinophaga nivalis]|uniref:Oxidoreductase n=1 Tax=Chitinophaga nivalis TaxID=2991709 RepID=A0ABT3IHP7_9BACT|nr:oxidoreductase [Chitinophaga nivalis]MCW3466814.1 oxidoreductase [Chitinophaga nivalis]MCW3483495.1 oxidoreductase [Chitinophaga nivalis]